LSAVDVLLLILTGLAMAAAVAAGVYAILLASREKRGQRYLDGVVDAAGVAPPQRGDSEADQKLPALLARLITYSQSLQHRPAFARTLAALATDSRLERIKRRMAKAGCTGDFTDMDFLGAQLFSAAAATVIMVVYISLLGFSLVSGLLLPVGAFFGARMTESFLTTMGEKRKREIHIGLAPAVDILVVAVEAGMNLDRAIELYCDRFENTLADELSEMQQEVRVGVRRRDALRNLAERVEYDGMSNLVSAIIQAERYGVPIGQALRTQSEDLKRYRVQFMREQVMKVPVKMMIPMATLIMPSLLVILGGPMVVQFLSGGVF